MENIRIISRLDIKGPNVIKGVFTEGLKIVGHPKELALKYYNHGADEILYMDVVASLYQRNLDFDLLKSVAENIFVPITVGGGIRSIGDIDNVLRSGADKIAVNTYAIHHPEFISEAVKKFGSQCIVLSVEAKKIGNNKWEAYTDGGRERTGIDAVDWVRKAVSMGVGEVVITSIDKDGTRQGYDLELISAITAFSTVPVIAHGGAGSKESVAQAITISRPDAVAAASVFHYNDFTISSLKNFLHSKKLRVRKM